MTLDNLIAFGANVDEGLSRCMNNETFYLRLVESLKSRMRMHRFNDRGFYMLRRVTASRGKRG